jgi:DNA-binding FadR family transcriptional regulator
VFGLLELPIISEREEAIQVLKTYIADGGYHPGDRLPPERELIVSLGMGRTMLRRALEALERDGAIWRHVGKGTFIAAEPLAGALSELTKKVSPVHMMRARLSLEPAIAREAAINASEDAVVQLRHARERAEAARDWDDYEAQDDAFHRSVAEATNNALLLALFDQLNQVHRAVAWHTVVRRTDTPPSNHSSFTEHKVITEAIEARDPASAQSAMRAHWASVSARLFGEV